MFPWHPPGQPSQLHQPSPSHQPSLSNLPDPSRLPDPPSQLSLPDLSRPRDLHYQFRQLHRPHQSGQLRRRPSRPPDLSRLLRLPRLLRPIATNQRSLDLALGCQR